MMGCQYQKSKLPTRVFRSVNDTKSKRVSNQHHQSMPPSMTFPALDTITVQDSFMPSMKIVLSFYTTTAKHIPLEGTKRSSGVERMLQKLTGYVRYKLTQPIYPLQCTLVILIHYTSSTHDNASHFQVNRYLGYSGSTWDLIRSFC